MDYSPSKQYQIVDVTARKKNKLTLTFQDYTLTDAELQT